MSQQGLISSRGLHDPRDDVHLVQKLELVGIQVWTEELIEIILKEGFWIKDSYSSGLLYYRKLIESIWQKYTGQQPVGFFCVENNEHGRPGPIDNSDIVADQTDVDDDDDRRLLRTLLQGRDYVLLPEEGWERLYSWYKGGPVIARKMITVGSAAKQLIVEMFPLCLTLIDSRDDSESCLRLSKKASLRELYHVVGQLKGFEPEKFRVRDYFDRRKWLVLVPSSGRILEDSQLQMDQHILLEVESYGTWSSESSATDYWKPARSSSFTIAGGPSLSNGYSTGLSSSNIYQGISVRESREEEEEEMEDECDDNTKQESNSRQVLPSTSEKDLPEHIKNAWQIFTCNCNYSWIVSYKAAEQI
ncbi:OLC1v1005857C1 [Oldenlandia corymbosa var. corymbosa]|uniref:OLC1v1005857C1 n=1 Tax=Oldenlandia corymbosa var. corymbosa TaxID=529605 RepID=A0AAV1DFP2_OLDCO|nr:OLC1v1005857C1 [Oldenlandia corymbosa var. corymbosa]